jgi:putative Mn2+ efflux pump MntP
MNVISVIFLALAMSTDAFAAAVGKGAALHKPQWRETLRMGLIFGIIESLTPILGWVIGQAASHFVSQWSHWITFGLLFALGLNMIKSGASAPETEIEKPTRHSFLVLAVTAFATSIDAMAVGVGLAFAKVNILFAAGAIGVATFTMVTIGVMLGRVIGEIVGKRAEILGGVVLIFVGSAILFEHFHV